MQLSLCQKCYFIKGYKNAAIYDLNNNKVYSINEYGKYLIDAVITNTNIALSKKDLEYLDKLKDLKLLTENINYNNNLLIERNSIGIEFAWLELTDLCNLRCIHCYGEFGNSVINKSRILSINDWKEIIDKLLDIDCKNIQLIGGEPLMHKDFMEILDYSHKKGFKRIDLFTNGTLIDETIAKKLGRYNINVRVSVYGHNPVVHDSITKVNGSFEKNRRGLELLKKYSVNTSIAIIIMKENEAYLDEIKKYIESIGHKYSGYDVVRPTCFESHQKHAISNINILKSRYNTRPVFHTSEKDFIRNHFYNSCWNGKIAITSCGDVLPCIFSRNDIVGNIKADNEDYLKNEIIKKWSITKDNMDKLFLTGRHVTLSLYDEKYNNFLFECYNDIESRKLYTNDSSLLSIWNFLAVLKNKIRKSYHTYMIIINNKTCKPVGFIYSHDFDYNNGITYTTIFILKEFRAKGIALEAGILFYDYLFTNFPIRKIYCTVFNYNKESFKFLYGLGFKVEGELIKHKYFNGDYHNMFIMSLTRETFVIILDKFSKYINKINQKE